MSEWRGWKWAVRVNEARLHSVDTGCAWWFWYRRNAEAGGRITSERGALTGDQVLVWCDDEDHAAWLARYMHKMGLPRSSAQVVRK